MQAVLCLIRQGGNSVFFNSELITKFSAATRASRSSSKRQWSHSRKNSVEMTYCFIVRSHFSP